MLALTVGCTATAVKLKVFHGLRDYIEDKKVKKRSLIVRTYKKIRAFKQRQQFFKQIEPWIKRLETEQRNLLVSTIKDIVRYNLKNKHTLQML